MIICKTLKTTRPLFSVVSLEKAVMVELLATRYMAYFPFQEASTFESSLQHALTNGSLRKPILTYQHLTMIHLFFNEEYVFTRQAFSAIQNISDQTLNSYDFLQLLELVICTNWQLSPSTTELAHFINGFNFFTKAVCQQLGTSIYFLKKEQPNFLRHIQFLIVRILQSDHKHIEETDELDHFIQQRYPEAFVIADNLCGFILEAFHTDLSPSERTFLALHIEKCRSNPNR